MRLRAASFALLVLSPLASARAALACADSTKSSGDRTLFEKLHLRGAHLDIGGGSGRVDNASTGISDSRIGVSLCAWPTLTFSLTGTAPVFHRTSYVAPGSGGFRPPLYAPANGFEVMHRWNSTRVGHVLAGGIVGNQRAEYNYVRRESTGAEEHFVEGRSSTWFVTPEVGGEVNLFTYMRAYFLVGYRLTGALSTPGIGPRGLSGLQTTLLLGFGKF